MSTIHEQRLSSWTEFDQFVRNKKFRRWVYRGHTDAKWSLESSLYRLFKDVRTVTRASRGKPKILSRSSHERVAIQKFMATARQYDMVLPTDNDPLEWLAIMQHYGAPTRLLDATFSPYVAAYFSIENGTGDTAVFCFRQRVFQELDEDYFRTNVNEIYSNILTQRENIIYVYEPRHTTPRLLAQQGLFLVPSSLTRSHNEIIEIYNLTKNDAVKLIIPAKLRDDGVHHLRSMNISSTMLFPGIVGFCRSLRHQPYFVVQDEGRIGELDQESRSDENKRAKRDSPRA